MKQHNHKNHDKQRSNIYHDTKLQERWPPRVPRQSSKDDGAKRIDGPRAHHHKTNKMDPKSTGHIVLPGGRKTDNKNVKVALFMI